MKHMRCSNRLNEDQLFFNHNCFTINAPPSIIIVVAGILTDDARRHILLSPACCTSRGTPPPAGSRPTEGWPPCRPCQKQELPHHHHSPRRTMGRMERRAQEDHHLLRLGTALAPPENAFCGLLACCGRGRAPFIFVSDLPVDCPYTLIAHILPVDCPYMPIYIDCPYIARRRLVHIGWST